jgi:hypothetical protein
MRKVQEQEDTLQRQHLWVVVMWFAKATLQDSLQRQSEKQTLKAIGYFQRKVQ